MIYIATRVGTLKSLAGKENYWVNDECLVADLAETPVAELQKESEDLVLLSDSIIERVRARLVFDTSPEGEQRRDFWTFVAIVRLSPSVASAA